MLSDNERGTHKLLLPNIFKYTWLSRGRTQKC